MRRYLHKYRLVLFIAAIGITLGFTLPATARLYDPMKPEHPLAQTSSTDKEDVSSELALLSAIIGTASSRVAVFGTKQVREGEWIGRHRIEKIHSTYVEISDGETLLERHLFPTFTVSKGRHMATEKHKSIHSRNKVD